jgi:two-component system sensor histidine kinase AtoS
MSEAAAPSTILELRDVHASYGTVKALRGVDFELRRGEIHALVGEHGAGKSTLVKLISGELRKERGEIRVDGERVELLSPRDSLQKRIGVVTQDQSIIASFNAVENIFAGRMYQRSLGRVRYAAMEQRARGLLSTYGVSAPLGVPLAKLSRAQKNTVELLRLVALEPEIAVFDEVSSRFAPEEMETVYRILFDLKEKGKSVIYISHDLDEIFRFADRVTILREGTRTGTESIGNIDRAQLIRMTYSFVLSRQALEQDNLQLLNIKRYNETIIKNIPMGIVILDSEDRVYLTNYAVPNILKLELRQVMNQPVPAIFSGDVRPPFDEVLQHIERRESFTIEEVAWREDKWLRISTFPFYDEDGSFIGTIILIQDITQEKYFKEYWLRTERVASIAQLAAGVAHEINNPLGIVSNYITLLRMKNLEPACQQKLADMEKEVSRISEIVQNLLSFSKVNELSNQRLDLGKTLREVTTLLTHQFEVKEVAITSRRIEPEVRILGNENRMKQLFINLLVNGLEAVQPGGEVTLELWKEADKGVACFRISDNGSGVPESQRERIFDPFFSTKKSEKNVGLGLTICHDIVENHNGIITVSSPAGGGASFLVRLPLCQKPAE